MAELQARANRTLASQENLLATLSSSRCGSLQTDIAHPCYRQLAAVKTGYSLTSIT